VERETTCTLNSKKVKQKRWREIRHALMMIPSRDPRKALTRLQLGGEVWEDLSPSPQKKKN